MTTLNLTKIKPRQITGLTATQAAVKGIQLNWDAAVDSNQYEVWKSTTDFDPTVDAVKIGTTETNSYLDSELAAGDLGIYWVKGVNEFGTPSVFSNGIGPSNLGVYFKQLACFVYAGSASSSGSASISIDNLKVKVTYTDNTGASTDTGLVAFTTAVTQSSFGYISWSNPGNARVDDTSYATVTTTAGNYSENLYYTLSDLSIPDDAIITNVEFRIDGKTTSTGNTYLSIGLTRADLFSNSTFDQSFPSFAANNVDEVLTVNQSAVTWGLTETLGTPGIAGAAVGTGEVVSDYFDGSDVKVLNGGAYANLIAYDNGGGSTGFTSATGTNTTAYGLSGVTGVSGGSSTTTDIMTSTSSRYGNVPGYGTWYIVAQAGNIQLAGSFSPIPIVIEAFTQWTFSNVVVTSSNTCEVKIRFRLRNTTDSTEVTREFLLFKQTGTQIYACQPNFNYTPNIMYPDLSVSKMSLTQNKDYTLFLEVQKNRSSTDTVDARCTTAFLNFGFGR